MTTGRKIGNEHIRIDKYSCKHEHKSQICKKVHVPYCKGINVTFLQESWNWKMMEKGFLMPPPYSCKTTTVPLHHARLHPVASPTHLVSHLEYCTVVSTAVWMYPKPKVSNHSGTYQYIIGIRTIKGMGSCAHMWMNIFNSIIFNVHMYVCLIKSET